MVACDVPGPRDRRWHRRRSRFAGVIRHRPFGLGHPYRVEPDQRVPPEPEAGEPIELRATAPADVPAVDLLVEIAGRPLRIACRPLRDDELAGPPASGHLAAAAARPTGRGRLAW